MWRRWPKAGWVARGNRVGVGGVFWNGAVTVKVRELVSDASWVDVGRHRIRPNNRHRVNGMFNLMVGAL